MVLKHVSAAAATLPPEEEPSSIYKKAEFVQDVLMGVLSLKATLETLGVTGGQGLVAAVLISIDLGESASVLELAEAGHWDEVAFLRERRVGRPKGKTGSEWNDALLPNIQAWIDANPTARQADLVRATFDLLEQWKSSKNDKRTAPREASSVKRALTKMKNAGQIKVPSTFRWSK